MNLKKINVLFFGLSLLFITIFVGCTTKNSATINMTTTTSTTTQATESFFTTDTVHTISIDVADDTLTEMLTAYQKDGSKNWIEANVTIDGETFKKVGLKLKGNSTLKNAEKQAVDDIQTEELPWVIRLDKYVDNQAYLGRTRFVVRGNNTKSSLNEAISLAMLTKAGVETEDSAFTRFSVNDSSESLRLVIDVPDDDLWTEDHFGTEGLLYKATSDGDYTYRGTDATSYEDAFEQKYGKENLTPLITFLDFINNSTDEEFSEKLSDYLDIDAFATYLVMQELVANDDAIDGPGNNAYLYYDTQTKKMTVVAWDQNLSFGGMGDMGENMGMPPGEDDDFKERMTPPDNAAEFPEMPAPMDGDYPGGPMGGKENALVTRFLENDTFSALVAEKKTEYSQSILDSNFAKDTLAAYQALLTKEASDLIDEETLTNEADTITKYLEGTIDKETTQKKTAETLASSTTE